MQNWCSEKFIYLELLCPVLYGHIDEKQELSLHYQYLGVEIAVEMKGFIQWNR